MGRKTRGWNTQREKKRIDIQIARHNIVLRLVLSSHAFLCSVSDGVFESKGKVGEEGVRGWKRRERCEKERDKEKERRTNRMDGSLPLEL